MLYPPKETGQLIKKYRLDQNMSQESLCHGICAVSYLSKIESGLVTASVDIIQLLFKALDITYTTDEAFLLQGKGTLESFFKSYFFHYYDECTRLFNILSQDEHIYLFSPLMLDYELAKAYYSLWSPPENISDIYKNLIPYSQTFSSTHYFYFIYLEGIISLHIEKDYDKAIQRLTTANAMKQTSAGLAKLGLCYFFKGNYPLSIDTCEDAFKFAVNEGNISWALDICLTQAGAYSNMKNTFLMLKYYNRALNLCEGIGDLKYKEHIYYNLGATFLTLKDYDKALSYCLQSLALAQLNHTTNVSLYHKLALIYLELHNKEDANSYLSLAYKELSHDAAWESTFSKKSLDLVAIRLKDDKYLYNPQYIELLEQVYKHIGDELHHGFKQFHGDYLIACYKANRRYKDALHVTEELYVNQSHFLQYT